MDVPILFGEEETLRRRKTSTGYPFWQTGQILAGFDAFVNSSKCEHDSDSNPWNISLGCILTIQTIKTRFGSV